MPLAERPSQRLARCAGGKLHFDFSHNGGLAEAQLQQIHKVCHKSIEDDQQVFIADLALEPPVRSRPDQNRFNRRICFRASRQCLQQGLDAL
ncbi:uncharacterized protein BDV17DRAFT_151320 [Aspergillus undulatus]|uniref:uncharacterized protein n=1 Tax=Aspergillus undulatus TaxID=1810928 RepID=UPI003CCCC7E4